MVERRGHLRLTLEAAARRSVGQLRGQELDGHWPVEFGIDSTKHFTHAAGAEQSFNFVRSYLDAGRDNSACRTRARLSHSRLCRLVQSPGLR